MVAAAAAAAGADDGGNGDGIAVVAPTVSAFGCLLYIFITSY